MNEFVPSHRVTLEIWECPLQNIKRYVLLFNESFIFCKVLQDYMSKLYIVKRFFLRIQDKKHFKVTGLYELVQPPLLFIIVRRKS